jgi:hypothetical protein
LPLFEKRVHFLISRLHRGARILWQLSLAPLGMRMRDPINVLYTDIPVAMGTHFQTMSDYAGELRRDGVSCTR